MGANEIEPETKDWTWVIDRACDDCGFDGPGTPPGEVASGVRANAEQWRTVLKGPDVARRPAPGVWSPLEYACHVRDVNRLFAERVALMLERVDPELAAWDQDHAAIEGEYAASDPGEVATELLAAAGTVAAAYDAVADHGDGPAAWQRTGRRSDGSRFTVDSIARYHLHDLVHHAWDAHPR
ncbi:DinB family protein [Nocardioides sp. AE5]|uniref:DinB family protein n=1 Tax=Nocardioides sp. AE5 TaxID=2962573 RepID=UPI002882319B|nr:DinB family protein [Nocardioides sp. AE5]MDT0203360.1 DinB family protein [Nocardioides sp. AE5]